MTKLKVRFPPSPTGFLHVGGLRTALFNYLFAKQNKGVFLVRLEDTDQARFVQGAPENILESLEQFHLSSDEGLYWDDAIKAKGDLGPYKQSERLELYKKYAGELVAAGKAYYCFCTQARLEELRKQQEAAHLPPRYDKLCLNLKPDEVQDKLAAHEPHVIRMNINAGEVVELEDLVHGRIDFSTNELDDQVLLKSDGFPTYHLANVVDDHLMEVTHVIRGEEWIPSTPKHILLYRALGWDLPKFAHLPLLLSTNRKKLSKRDGDVAVKDFLEKGYLPEALLNFVALLGWNPKTPQEVFTLEELIEQFSFDKVNKSGAIFDLEKLDWINGLYIRNLSLDELFERIKPYLPLAASQPKEFMLKILALEQERLHKFSEIGERVQYFFTEPEYDPTLLVWKKGSVETTKQILTKLPGFLAEALKDNDREALLKSWIAENHFSNGDVLWPLRVALSGLAASPGPFEIMDAFMSLPNGKEIILSRIENASKKL